MSLINEALKKAQKLRAEEPTAVPPAMPGGPPPAPITPRRQPWSARTVVWSVFGAVSLIIFSIAFTILFLGGGDKNSAPAPRPSQPTLARAPAISPSSAPVTIAPAPPVPAPEIKPALEPQPAEVPVLVPAPAQQAPSPTVDAPVEPASPPRSDPVVINPAPSPAPAPAPTRTAPPRPDPQVYRFIDTLRITGIRASATDPKVLMNDRLFRLNDIVDRGFGLRLTRIEPSSLTFVDNTGAVYTKNF
ncbi:MAG TPA: hypothetical protein VGD81_01150 [Opitutaceae bacterium]